MLQWNHDWGTKAAHYETLHRAGRRVPAGFANQPEVLPAALFYWSAFCALESERYIGMTVGPIPRSKVRDYAFEQGIDDADDFANLWQIIARLDGEAMRMRRPRDDEDDKFREKVSIKDGGGVKNMMRSLGKKPRK